MTLTDKIFSQKLEIFGLKLEGKGSIENFGHKLDFDQSLSLQINLLFSI